MPGVLLAPSSGAGAGLHRRKAALLSVQAQSERCQILATWALRQL